MISRFRIRAIDLMVVLSIVGYAGWKAANSPASPKIEGDSSFAAKVDLSPFDGIAVQTDGRLRSFGSHTKTYMSVVSGSQRINDQSRNFTYLDMMFRPQRYQNADIIYIKNKIVREQILAVLKDNSEVETDHAEQFRKHGLISRTLLTERPVLSLLQRLSQDLIKTAKSVNAINSALTVSDPMYLAGQLRVIAPPSGNINEPWIDVGKLTAIGSAPRDNVHAGMQQPSIIPNLDVAFQNEASQAWTALKMAWNEEDATVVNEQLVKLAGLFPTISPQLYPSHSRLLLESWYFNNNSMTWVWLLYLASVLPLLMSIIYKWDGARTAGMVLFVLAFILQTASIGIRWYISGRWPNANMFEAVTTAAWMGGVAALILERIARKTAFRNVFALGSGVMSMFALMVAYFLPTELDSAIGNKMAALNDIWLYIHTNMIIWSYAVIGLACVPAILYLRYRWCLAWDNGAIPKARLMVLPVAIVVSNWTGYALLMSLLDHVHRGLGGAKLFSVAGAFWASVVILALELLAARERRLAGMSIERTSSGGAAALMTASGGVGGGSSFLQAAKPTAGQVFDGATMVLVEVAFIMLWTGTVMGAVWADHSWGRPWGWDPKEVFALNTFIIFLILIHVRLKVKDKGFWTAVIAIIGFEVMMFNWIVVNFVITGLHSYA